MEKKFWFDFVDLKTLEKYVRKHVVGNIYDMERIKDKDLIKIEYDVRNDDYTYSEYLTPYGLTNSENLVDGYNHSITNSATKELFQIIYKSTKGISINGKTYPEAFNEMRGAELRNTLNSKIDKINKDIEKLEAVKSQATEEFFKDCKDLETFVSPVIEQDKREKSLIVTDILKSLSPKEQKELLAQLGYAPVKEKKKEESTLINNGLNDIVLDFDKPSTTEGGTIVDIYKP